MKISFLDFLYTAPLWSIALFSFLPLLTKAISKGKEMRPLWVVSVAFVSFCFSIISMSSIGYKNRLVFSNLLRLDQPAWLFSIVILMMGIMTLFLLLGKKNHVVNNKFFSEFVFLFMNSVLGLCLITWSNNLISAFIAIEYISLCFYMMIPLAKDRVSSIEAGLKYFVLGSVAAAILLLGLSFIYIAAGSFDFNVILHHSQFLIQNNRLFILGLSCICIALLFKVAIFPFQFWLPDVYQGSATPLAAFMSTAVKASVLVLLLKLVFFGGFITHSGQSLMILFQWLAILSLIVGHVSALFQDNFKRLLIYSSVGHAGYIIMNLLIPNLFSVSSLFYYLISYGVIQIGAMAYIMFFEGEETTGHSIQHLKGFFSHKPFYALTLTWFLLNLAGIPPTAGFFAKLFVFEALVQKGLWWMLFWAVLGSIVGLAYYLKPIILMFTPSEEKSQFESLPWVKSLIVILLFISLYLSFGAGLIHNWMTQLWM